MPATGKTWTTRPPRGQGKADLRIGARPPLGARFILLFQDREIAGAFLGIDAPILRADVRGARAPPP
eukprot:8429774-Pyramimonas_sp.AAC.1